MRVLISGAGIAGSSLAWFLARAGIHVIIVEKSRSILPHGQNIDIQGSAITAIKRMGLLDEIRRMNTTEKGTKFIDSKGRPFAVFPQTGSSASPTSDFEILRGDLASILYDATKDHPNATYLFDTSIKEVVSNNEHSVKVELSNGEVREFDLLVAADGQWSKLRKQCFSPDSVKVVDQGMYAVYWTIPRLPSDNDWWNIYIALKSRVVTLRPDPHGTIRAMFTLMPCNEGQKTAWLCASRGDRQTREKLLRQEFADAGWQVQRLLGSMEQAPDFYFQAIQQIKMSKWSSSRVVCLGDAAFAPTPLTGMGTSLAITGAYILAGELNSLSDGENPSKALEAYESTFRPFVEKVQEIPPIFPGVAHPKTAFKRWLLQSFVWTFSKFVAIPGLANRLFGTPGESNDEGFPLPAYPSLDDKVGQRAGKSA